MWLRSALRKQRRRNPHKLPRPRLHRQVFPRTTKAITYNLRGSVKVDFHGTDLLRGGSGEAKVEAKKTTFEIDAKFSGLDDPVKFGFEYLTYVLWAISPEGRAINLGELVLDKSNARLKTETNLQTFGMIVTVEPYFAVTQPGSMVVLENIASDAGRQQEIAATYQLLGTGTYRFPAILILEMRFSASTRRLHASCLKRRNLRFASRILPPETNTQARFFPRLTCSCARLKPPTCKSKKREIVESAARETALRLPKRRA